MNALTQPDNKHIAWYKALIFLLCLLPALNLGWLFLQDELGANPIEALTRGLGDWALRFLLITLAITPLRRLFQLHWLLRLRRMLGLYTFAYAVLHLSGYVVLDQFFDWGEIIKDILKRPFITVGMGAFLLLIPLALTSTNAMIRRLGGRNWQALHRLVYAIALLVIAHYWMMVKLDIRQPLFHGLILAVLLGLRLWWSRQDRRKQMESLMPKPPAGRKIIPITSRR